MTRRKYVFWTRAGLLAILLITAWIRWRLIEAPLERDEGEYAYGAQLLLQGLIPYTHIYSMKLPGIYVVYALLLKLFGQTIIGIHLGLLIANALSIVLVYRIGALIMCRTSGLMAAAFFAVHSLGSSVQGVFANSEHFVIPFALSGFLILLSALKKNRSIQYILSGLFFGVATLVKQHAASFALTGGVVFLLLMRKKASSPRLPILGHGLLYIAGVVLPYALTCIVFLFLGSFRDLFYWTFVHAREYVGLLTPAQGYDHFTGFFGGIWHSNWPIWLLAAIGAGLILCRAVRSQNYTCLLTFAMSSLLAICPGLYFRPHYFVLSLPAVSLLAALGLQVPLKKISSRLAAKTEIGDRVGNCMPFFRLTAVLLALAIPIRSDAGYLFSWSPYRVSREVYGLNPFPESIEIAEYVAANTESSDRIAVIGSEPQIYFYSQRNSATGYVYMYPLMEPGKPYSVTMQRQMISEIEAVKPKYLIYVNVSASWIRRAESSSIVFTWFNAYQQQYYQEVGYVDLIDPNNVVSVWDEDVRDYRSKGRSFIVVLKRR